MVFQQTNDGARLRRQQTEQAIKAAMQSRWDDAVRLNTSIIELSQGNDSDAFNRLGRALMALGRYGESRDAYTNALRLNPSNQIARKNLTALENKVASEGEGARSQHVDPRLFVEETGKTGIVPLGHPNRESLVRMTPGERVYLRREGNVLFATNSAGETLGQIDTRTGLRLIRLMEGGNEYAAAISQLSADGARIIIKETFQHASQVGRLSFPPSGADGMPRAYTRDSVRRYEEEDDEDAENESDTGDTWDTDTDQRDATDNVRLLDFPKVNDRDDMGYDEE
jgi:tetratricopeptide (TPR) repeat protein